MPTIKQLIRNARQPIRNVAKSPGDVLSAEEYVLGCMCDSFRLYYNMDGTKKQMKGKNFSSINDHY